MVPRYLKLSEKELVSSALHVFIDASPMACSLGQPNTFFEDLLHPFSLVRKLFLNFKEATLHLQ